MATTYATSTMPTRTVETRMSVLALAPLLRRLPDADAGEDDRDQDEETAGLGRDVADAEPRRLLVDVVAEPSREAIHSPAMRMRNQPGAAA